MKYKSCQLLFGGIEFRYNGVALCQRVDHVGGGDILVQIYDDKTDKKLNLDVQTIFEKKKEIIEQNKTGNLYEKCVGCIELKEKEWPEINEQKISQLILHHWTKCNSHCIYCYTNSDKEYFNKRKNYKILPILKELDKKKLLAYGGICTFAGGEISCLPEFEAIVKILNKFDYGYMFNSSCVKYEKTVEKHLQKGNGILIVSTDSGTKELHTKIKQVDTFEKVWKNISKYAKAARKKEQLYTKYIILKDINDNEEAITDFLIKSKESGVQNVLMEIEHYYFCANRDDIPKYIIDLFYFAFNKAREFGLECRIYSNSSVLLLQGKWANEFWRPYVFDAGADLDVHILRRVYGFNMKDVLSRYPNIMFAAKENELLYPQVWKVCEKNHKGQYSTIKNKSQTFFYAEDLEVDGVLNKEKVSKMISKKNFPRNT